MRHPAPYRHTAIVTALAPWPSGPVRLLLDNRTELALEYDCVDVRRLSVGDRVVVEIDKGGSPRLARALP